jgi:hypothetical protein
MVWIIGVLVARAAEHHRSHEAGFFDGAVQFGGGLFVASFGPLSTRRGETG